MHDTPGFQIVTWEVIGGGRGLASFLEIILENHRITLFSLAWITGVSMTLQTIVIKAGENVRRNIMQRNVARSTGARSGSNNNKGN